MQHEVCFIMHNRMQNRNGNQFTEDEVDTVDYLKVDDGARSQIVSVSAVSAQSAALTSDAVRVVSTVDVFVRKGANPTAVVNVDMMIPANTPTVLSGFNIFGTQAGAGAAVKLAFIAGGAGSVYISPMS